MLFHWLQTGDNLPFVSLEGVGDQVIVVSPVETYGAVITDELPTGLTVDLELFPRMLWAVSDLFFSKAQDQLPLSEYH